MAVGVQEEEWEVELPREFVPANLPSRIHFSVCFCALTLALMDGEKSKHSLGCCPLTLSSNTKSLCFLITVETPHFIAEDE
ncbi:hypothetical protein NQZ68_026036 [Dissostichus eleginoides]|nr:hypothetical protein NQZ68_037174 [Dissostichus eleginoides]KAI9527994.1 hypothetical protein NQZ68_026036 [Dissostichus eleginoides]